MSKLIVVSNRVPSAGAKGEAGGLVVALGQALSAQGGAWVGWSGDISATPEVHERHENNIHYRTVDLEQVDYDDFYGGYSNAILWPLCHYRLDLCQFKPEMYNAYDRVNKRFADQVTAVLEPGDMIWAQDYHLMLLATHLRARGVKERIGFFMHIPFPAPEVLVALPHYLDILKGLSAYDVIGFQTDSDMQSFLRCLAQLTKNPIIDQVDADRYDVRALDRKFKVGRFPISIDTLEMMAVAEQSASNPQTVKLRESLGDRLMLIGVDRLDYTKGLVERLDAYHYFLRQWPEFCSNVSYVQITPPSRSDIADYDKIRGQLEGTAARINGMNAEINWVPIRYINRSFSRDELAGFYRTARVGLVTPLRDGMNLVAKEYVASQDPEDPGVLILSRFAGAADELRAGALLINPYNAVETGENIHRALAMSRPERKWRYNAMMAVLKRDDIFAWTSNFLSCLEERDVKVPRKISVGEGTGLGVKTAMPPVEPTLGGVPDLAKTFSLVE